MNKIGIRYEDEAEAALERVGFVVCDRAGVNDYQGWGVLMGKSGEEFAVISWSYGSCPVCDEYEEMSDSDCEKAFSDLVERGLTMEAAQRQFDSSKSW